MTVLDIHQVALHDSQGNLYHYYYYLLLLYPKCDIYL